MVNLFDKVCLQGIVAVVFIKTNNYPVQDDEYNNHD